jgi:hypothetical protein
MNDFPRRNQLDKCTPAELAIYNAIVEVEKMSCPDKHSLMLTEAIRTLQEAKHIVSDIVDDVQRPIRPEQEYPNKTPLDRIIDELDSLNEKRKKLEDFLNSGKAQEIESIQFSLLKVQLSAMTTYGKCLLERIIWFQKVPV